MKAAAGLCGLQLQGLGPDRLDTDLHVQYLEDNETLITSALQLLSQGRAAEAAKLQTLLQRNLMWLASIADSQAQPPQPAPAEASSQVCLRPPPCPALLHHYAEHHVYGHAVAHSSVPTGPFQAGRDYAFLYSLQRTVDCVGLFTR